MADYSTQVDRRNGRCYGTAGFAILTWMMANLSLSVRWRRLLRLGPPVLFLAFLPSLLYVGHWGELLSGGVSVSQEHLREHAAHCHIGPATCSEQPATSSVQAVPDGVELPEPAWRADELGEAQSTLSEFLASPPTEPPRL